MMTIDSSPLSMAFVLVVAAGGCHTTPQGNEVAFPDGKPGIGFDDLRMASSMGGRVIAPGGRAGKVYLVDPQTKEVTVIDGFGKTANYSGGHDDGPTSVDEGRDGKLLFVTDRTTGLLSVVDVKERKIIGSASLASGPDYVRFVEATNELWVTEPSASQLEIFALNDDGGGDGGGSGGRSLKSVAIIPVPNGPESLVIDQARGRAYTHHWQASTVAMDVRTRAIVKEWKNGCSASRGIELEPEHGWVLTACNEGTVTAADPEKGTILSSVSAGSGNDVMGYARSSRHIYVAGGACACLMIVGLSTQGALSVLGRFDAPSDTHCAAADDRGHAWVCDPSAGGLRRVDDSFPLTR